MARSKDPAKTGCSSEIYGHKGLVNRDSVLRPQGLRARLSLHEHRALAEVVQVLSRYEIGTNMGPAILDPVTKMFGHQGLIKQGPDLTTV